MREGRENQYRKMITKEHNNCFDVIRHLAALSVLYSHHFALLKLPEPSVLQWQSYGGIAVLVFFTISGYLMPGAFTRSGSFLEFIIRRLRRLIPALAACTFLTTYVIGARYSTASALDYILSIDTFSMWLSSTLFLRHEPPGSFPGYLTPNAINGSLWTLPIEFACYIFLSVAMTYSASAKSMATLLIVSMAGAIWSIHVGADFMWYQVPLPHLFTLGIAFSVGALLSMTQPAWRPRWKFLLVASAAMLFILQGTNEIRALGSAAVAVITVVTGTMLRDRLIKGRFDISYGIYIYAFPIQQIVINRITKDLWVGMALAAALLIRYE